MIEQFGLERTFKGHLVDFPCNEQRQLQLSISILLLTTGHIQLQSPHWVYKLVFKIAALFSRHLKMLDSSLTKRPQRLSGYLPNTQPLAENPAYRAPVPMNPVSSTHSNPSRL